MLVLSRKLNESIIIDNQIKITVVEIRGDKIRLGIEAPKDVAVHRREVYDAIRRQVAGLDDSMTNQADGRPADQPRPDTSTATRPGIA